MLLHLPERGTTQGLTPGRNLLEFFFLNKITRKISGQEGGLGGFPGGPVVKNLPCNAKDTVWSLVRKDCMCRRATKPVRNNF